MSRLKKGHCKATKVYLDLDHKVDKQVERWLQDKPPMGISSIAPRVSHMYVTKKNENHYLNAIPVHPPGTGNPFTIFVVLADAPCCDTTPPAAIHGSFRN